MWLQERLETIIGACENTGEAPEAKTRLRLMTQDSRATYPGNALHQGIAGEQK